MEKIELFVSYTQIAVFHASLQDPFNDWNSFHVKQGFSWREGSVSFGTLINTGDVDIYINQKSQLPSDPLRQIATPFSVISGEKIEIATISDSFLLEIPSGNYRIIYSTGKLGDKIWINFDFEKGGDLNPKILIQDNELAPIYPLLMEANSAS